MDPTDGVAGWVSVPTSALQTIDLRHVASAVDLSIAMPFALGPLPPGNVITGYTHWAGAWRDGQIYVGWDWGVLRDVVIILDPSNIRTNIKLVMDSGNAIAPLLARVHLYEWIESLPWRAIGIEELIERHGH
jgi:hypothetical protein